MDAFIKNILYSSWYCEDIELVGTEDQGLLRKIPSQNLFISPFLLIWQRLVPPYFMVCRVPRTVVHFRPVISAPLHCAFLYFTNGERISGTWSDLSKMMQLKRD